MLVGEVQRHSQRDGTGLFELRQVSLASTWALIGQPPADSHDIMIAKGHWLRKWRIAHGWY